MQFIIDDDNYLALGEIGAALQRIAQARGYTPKVPVSVTQTHAVGEASLQVTVDTSDATTALEILAARANELGVTHVSVTETGDSPETPSALTATTDPKLDADGLPWDARIHAGSRETSTDGTWRIRRRPNGTDQAEWDATVARVRAELADLMVIPVSEGAKADAVAEEATVVVPPPAADLTHWVKHDTAHCGSGTVPDGADQISKSDYDAYLMSGYAERAADVPPPAADPVPTVTTFPQVMAYLTARTPKVDAERATMLATVNRVLVEQGLTALPQLNQRPELIPQVYAALTKEFGE